MAAALSQLNARSSGWYSKDVNSPWCFVKDGEFLDELTEC